MSNHGAARGNPQNAGVLIVLVFIVLMHASVFLVLFWCSVLIGICIWQCWCDFGDCFTHGKFRLYKHVYRCYSMPWELNKAAAVSFVNTQCHTPHMSKIRVEHLHSPIHVSSAAKSNENLFSVFSKKEKINDECRSFVKIIGTFKNHSWALIYKSP